MSSDTREATRGLPTPSSSVVYLWGSHLQRSRAVRVKSSGGNWSGDYVLKYMPYFRHFRYNVSYLRHFYKKTQIPRPSEVPPKKFEYPSIARSFGFCFIFVSNFSVHSKYIPYYRHFLLLIMYPIIATCTITQISQL